MDLEPGAPVTPLMYNPSTLPAAPVSTRASDRGRPPARRMKPCRAAILTGPFR